MKKQEIAVYGILFVLACTVRLYGFTNPLADWHSWRQADTAAVARNFLKSGVDPLHPRYDDLSNVQSGIDNPEGWRMVEFPLYQVTAVYLYKLFPQLSIETALRAVSIAATGGSVVLLGVLLAAFSSGFTGIIGAFLYAVLPFGIFYGRAILPDPFATFFALLSIYLLVISDKRKHISAWIIMACISGAISLLVRPMAIFLLFPAVYILFSGKSALTKKLFHILLYAVIISIPLLLWRRWILQFPEGIASSNWLLNKDNIRFKGAWFYWLYARRLAELILGYWGLIPFGLGLVIKQETKGRIFSGLWFSGALSYFIIFAGGNVQHDYYQALMIPVIVWFTALGLRFLIRRTEGISFASSVALAVVSVIFLWSFSWYTIRTYFWINRPEIVEAGKVSDKLLPQNAKVIAPYGGDTTFLYQTNRRGWPIGFDIDKKIAMGAQYYIGLKSTDDFWEVNQLARDYTVLVRNDTYAIIDLTNKK